MASVYTSSAFTFKIDGAISTASSLKWVAPCAGRIKAVYGAVGTAPVGADMLVDIHKDGTTIFTTQSNRLTIEDGESTGSATVTAAEIMDFAAGTVFELDVDQVGSGTAGSDLAVTIAFDGDPTPTY
jgi:hypothetical protein